MTLQVTQSVVATGTAPSPLTPAATDTIAAGSFGANGLVMRVITAGTLTTVTVRDPNRTVQGNPALVTGVTTAATGSVLIPIPPSSVDPSTLLASVDFSGARTGVTYELYRV
jgi:hypothetical protein